MNTITIQKNEHLFPEMRFVLEVIKKGIPDCCDFLYIEPEAIVATDGCRLHWYAGDHRFEPGLYNVVGNNRKEITIAETGADEKIKPIVLRWRDCIREHKNSFEWTSGNSLNADSMILAFLGKLDIGMKYKYTKPLADLGLNWMVFYGAPNEPVMFTSLGGSLNALLSSYFLDELK